MKKIAMPCIHEEEGIKYCVYSDKAEHGSPHIHCKYQAEEMVVYLDGTIRDGALPHNEQKKALDWIRNNQDFIKGEIDKISKQAGKYPHILAVTPTINNGVYTLDVETKEYGDMTFDVTDVLCSSYLKTMSDEEFMSAYPNQWGTAILFDDVDYYGLDSSYFEVLEEA